MKTKKTLSCYAFSNLIVSIFCFNFLITDNSLETIKISNNELNTLRKIYEIEVEVPQESVSVTNNVYTVSVTKKEVSSKNIQYIKPSYNSVTGKNIVNYAKHYLGLKYVHAGNSLTTGTDCSGFTKLIYKEFGINLGRTVSSQTYSGQYVQKSDLQPGDLVFYGYTNYATHVGIYMGDGLVIHQSNPSDGVKINSVNMMVYITARRVITEDVVSEVIEDTKEEPKENDTVLNEEIEVSDNNKENNIQEEIKEDIVKEDVSNKDDKQDDTLEEKENQKEEFDELLEKQESIKDEVMTDEIIQEKEEVKDDVVEKDDIIVDTTVDNVLEATDSNHDEVAEVKNDKVDSGEIVEKNLTDTIVEVVEKFEDDSLNEKNN